MEADGNIGFIGAGHINSAIIRGLLNDEDSFNRQRLMIATRSVESSLAAAKDFGVYTTNHIEDILAKAQYIVIGVKPQDMHALLMQLCQHDLSEHVIITLAAGIKIEDYRKILGDEVTIVRAMPNIAASVQAALTGIYSDDGLSEHDENLIEDIFSAIGSTAWLDDEIQLDGITALSGSGIAYFYRLMQAMAQAGEQYGFEKQELYDIITLTALGAATLAVESIDDVEQNADFATFIDQIAVKGGTTEQAITVFNQQNLDEMVQTAMQKVVGRSHELGEALTKDWA
ncbi:pyrroline-5-carboxylate reductase [Dichelobacter nodosus]|uniref:Pyrroline-5-carboxylate reductase n=1 Tax=Dichelobacter nodosus (strain VCS1703A) TaxID=246195 RepID=A5EV67_DICNV|nr:pyrroline-5-carboxylate reductase [Dichelobacter nodosus]ABQ13868.1 pyrroline-5-carboxylate reductase [Dichelobacter nodosus VCS1703A]KNZ39895.1 pyrroline-5-carboxylate reductase [Dichelobacter nodosus]TGA66733.1 pyrroline-5-carboxylate reductase [Dichelobacter nodosus]